MKEDFVIMSTEIQKKQELLFITFFKKKKRIMKIKFFIVVGIFFSVMMPKQLVLLVENGLKGINPDIKEYMLKKTIDNFDFNYFYNDLTSSLSGTSKNLLLTIYILCYTCYLMIFLLPLIYYFLCKYKSKFNKDKFMNLYLYLFVYDLINKINNPIKYKKLNIDKIYNVYLSRLIIPLKGNWFRKQTFDWFKTNKFSKETYLVIDSIRYFNVKINFSVKSDNYKTELCKGLESLKNYLYYVVIEDKRIFKSKDDKIDFNIRNNYLYDFAVNFRKIKIKNIKQTKLRLIYHKLLKIKDILIKFNIHIILGIAFLLAISVFVGTKLFGIKKDDAFQTWIIATATVCASGIIINKHGNQ